VTHAADAGQLIDAGRGSAYQRWLVALTALTITFDGIDNQLMGVAIPTIMGEWRVPRSAFAPVVSLGYLGMMAGGAIAGIVGDRLGRRTALVGSMLVFSVMTMAVTLVDGIAALGVLRFLAGLGLGGAIPNAAALAGEYVPLRQRPIAVTATIVCVPLGATIAGLAAIPALPAIGWRGLFFLGGALPLVAALMLPRLLPESPRFLARFPARRQELIATLRRMGCAVDGDTTFAEPGKVAVKRASVGELFVPERRGDTVALWLAFFSCLLAVYLGFSWIPSMLSAAGFTSTVASSGIAAFNLGGVAGALAGGVCITRWGSRVSMLALAGLAVLSAAAMSLMPLAAAAPVAPIIAMLAVTGGLINGVQTTMYALAVHVYPGPIRATGAGSAVSFGRIGAVVSGYVGAWALEYHGSLSFFAVIAVAMFVCTLALAAVRRHVPGVLYTLASTDHQPREIPTRKERR
jgi:AAHS family 4-hydroxybenzoate transporter-like MFS transporter